jgi:hypothetical protein
MSNKNHYSPFMEEYYLKVKKDHHHNVHNINHNHKNINNNHEGDTSNNISYGNIGG